MKKTGKASGGWIGPGAFSRPFLWTDILAGLTLWGVLVPEGLAYAGMAGLPVQVGLYTLIASLPLYFLLGQSPVLVCAATSAESIMLAAIVAPLAGADPVRYAVLAGLLVLLTGVIFLAAGLLRLGRVSAFLSKPVMTGFIFGLAISIAANQLHKILGLPRGHGDILAQLAHLAGGLDQCNPATVAVGGGALALVLVLERALPRLPAGLIIMALGIGLSRLLSLGPQHGVAIVAAFPAGLPGIVWPQLHRQDLTALVPSALGLALVAFSQALGAVACYAGKFGRPVAADQELKALGLANLGSSLLGGLLAGGSMSSTAVNVAAGARTRFSTLVTALMVVLTLCFFTPALTGLPEAILGAVVLHAVLGLMKVGEMRRYYRLNRIEFWLAMVALLGVVAFDILPGLVLAVVASLLRLILYAGTVNLSILGRLDGCAPVWVDTSQYPQAREVAAIRVVRLNLPLFFANAEKFHAAVTELCRQQPKPRALVLHLPANPRLCVTATDMLLALARELRADSVTLAFVDPAPQTLGILRASGLLALVGEARVYQSIGEAVAALDPGTAA
ncbi:SulP family inorganic anion transporter [Desulfovibrio sp. TomC]|uniref:SulP family inorganic anion transporter n=1 Tax=Desulfovibrio sp. TomC TaxID=1562888 RepID=UPI00057305E4|nr:SulP family inorganic anion transporter [Desulfovibrio sp. TomC]KHK02419.1 sulfate permease [Desulfovibrio sp. TomC]